MTPASPRGPALFVLAATAVAAVNFIWQLGASSLFVDEVYSWAGASVAWSDLIEHLRNNEVTPPTYFAALHEWIGPLGADSDAQMRLPSAICAVLLVPVLYDVGWRVASPAAGVAAAGFAALSPLVLDYAQQVRTYAPSMLVCTLAAACAVRAVDADDKGGRWAIATGVFAALAFSMHYTTLFVTAPLLGLVLVSRSIPTRARVAAGAIVALVGLALLPLMIDQLESGRQAAISPFAALTTRNVLSILGTPWDSRLNEPALYQVLAAAVTMGSIAWLLARGSRPARAVALSAIGPVAAAFVATLLSDDAIITRYTSVAAPFALVAIGAAVMSLAGAWRVAAIVLVLFLAASGTWRGHDRDARFADARAATAAIDGRWEPADVVVTPANDVTVDLPVRYYVGQRLPAGAEVVGAENLERLRAVFEQRARLWIVGRAFGDPAPLLERAGYRAEPVGRYRGSPPLEVTLGTPDAR